MYSFPPLVKRVVKDRSKFVESKLSTIRGAYRCWDTVSMQKAVKAVEEGMPLRQAAEIFFVPKSSLHDRVTGKVDFGARSGPRTYLSYEEEEEIASFLIQTAKIGYPHTKKQVLALVQKIVESKGIATTVSNGWWERFCQRHPKLTLKTAVPLSYSRAVATDPIVLDRYFDMLEETLQGNGIFNRPVHIFNCDETGLPLNPKCLKIVDQAGSRNPSYITGDAKSQITILGCTCAAGYAIPPFVIFKRKSLNPELTNGEVPGTLYGLSDSGWMTRELFNYWFTEHFLLYAPQIRPLLLLLDGHSTHYCPETINIAAMHNIIMFTLPPHTTHITQPLDRGCFAPLKVEWRQVCHTFFAQNPRKTISQYDFCELFAKAWTKSFSMKNIISSFKVTGICPFDRSVVKPHVSNEEEEEFSLFKPEVLARKTGLAYIPLYSPALERSTASSATPYQHLEPFTFNELSNEGHDESCLFISDFEPHILERSLSDSNLYERNFRESSVPPTQDSSKISKFLISRLPPRKIPTKRGKSSGLVLTSQDNLRGMQEREKKKEEEALQKEERKQIREEKAKLRKEETLRKKNEKLVEKNNNVLVESEGELEVCLPPRQTARNKKKVLVESEGELEVCLPPRQTARNKKKVLVESEGELEVCLPPRQTARSKKKVLVESEGELEVCLPPRQTARNKKKVLVESEGELEVCLPPRQTARSKKKVLVESEGELEVCLPPRQTARSKKKVLVESEGELEVCLPPRQTARNKKKVLVESEGELEVCLPPRQTARSKKKVLVESEGELEVCLPPRQTARSKKKVETVQFEDPYHYDQLWIKNLNLLESDKKCLETGADLSDKVINAAQTLLNLQFPHVSGFQNTLLGEKLKFSSISNFPTLQIIHTGSNHWICTSSQKSGVVQVVDSLQLYLPLNQFTILQIAQIYSIPSDSHILEIQTLSVQQQEGNKDCGLFSIATAFEICNGSNPEQAHFDQWQMRAHLIECFIEGKLTSFPRISAEPLPRPLRKLCRIKIFCYCRMPENYDELMILCDLCKKWFHCCCVNINADNIPDVWRCDSCVS